MRLSPAVNLHINQFSGTTITEYDRGLHNAIVQTIGEGRQARAYITQRPTIDIVDDASDTVADARGRGFYYWTVTGYRYFVNDDTIYKGDYSTVIGTISTGTRRVYFDELDTLLWVIDRENNEAWTINAAGTLTQISDAQFPPNLGTPVNLAHGAVVRDGYGFVLGVNGSIYNSDYEDLTAWGTTSFLTAERDPDGGSFICQHHDQIAAFGPATIEYFYNNNNPTGSPLNRNPNIFQNVGIVSGASAWVDGDSVFFLGVDHSGSVGAYVLENYVLRKISDGNHDAYFSSVLNTDQFVVSASGYHAGAHRFYIITFYTEPDDLSPNETLVYDDTAGIWGTWETTINSHNEFPVMAWDKRTTTTARNGEGIMSNGDIIALTDDLNPGDTKGATGGLFVDGVFEDGVFTDVTSSGTAMEMIIRFGMQDYGHQNRKFADPAMIICDRAQSSQSGTLTWSDEDSASFNAGRTIDINTEHRESMMGSFFRRNYQYAITADEPIRIEALDAPASLGS